MCLAVPAEVVSIAGTGATISVGGALRDVDITLVDEVSVGDYLLVHAGVALHRWTPADYREWQEITGQGSGRAEVGGG